MKPKGNWIQQFNVESEKKQLISGDASNTLANTSDLLKINVKPKSLWYIQHVLDTNKDKELEDGEILSNHYSEIKSEDPIRYQNNVENIDEKSSEVVCDTSGTEKALTSRNIETNMPKKVPGPFPLSMVTKRRNDYRGNYRRNRSKHLGTDMPETGFRVTERRNDNRYDNKSNYRSRNSSNGKPPRDMNFASQRRHFKNLHCNNYLDFGRSDDVYFREPFHQWNPNSAYPHNFHCGHPYCPY